MRPLPISREEFARLFGKARPPSGWPAHIGVANSGGPDSTCILFLIQRHIEDAMRSEIPSPARVSSLTVDHALQASSTAMAAHSMRTAAKLHIPHTTLRIPWGTPPFPPLPGKSQPFENVARMARYNLFWRWMQAEHIDALGMGHHADDQVETALMRLGRKSSELGGRGMLPCRRWGMGVKNDLEWAGYEGMSKWIIRPLLEVSKDRILATCEENELNYVTDSTNFQPEVTLRNALRATISKQNKGEGPLDLSTLPSHIQENLKAIDQAISSFPHLSVDLKSSSERLRAAIKAIDVYAQDIESQATAHFAKIRLLSPPGTFILSTRALQDIINPLLQRAIVLRILRYVSFHPWGSLRSQARRSKHSLNQIISRLWDPKPFHSPSGAFSAGGGVLWTPVVVDATESTSNFLDVGGRIKKPNPGRIRGGKVPLEKGVVGWIATRQPPHRPERMKEYGLEDTLNIDLSTTLRKGLKAWNRGKGEGPAIVEILWDCRFLIRFDLAKMPENIAMMLLNDTPGAPRLAIRWWMTYYYPKIVCIRHDSTLAWSASQGGQEEVLHSNIDSHIPSVLLKLKPRLKEKSVSTDSLKLYPTGKGKGNTSLQSSGWIHTSWIRVLDQC